MLGSEPGAQVILPHEPSRCGDTMFWQRLKQLALDSSSFEVSSMGSRKGEV